MGVKIKLNQKVIIDLLPAFFTGLLLAAMLVEIVYFVKLKPFYYPLNLNSQDLQVSFIREDTLDKKMKDMVLEEKIGKLMIVGFNGQSLNRKTIDFIQSHYFSNFLLLSKNIKDEKQLKALTDSLKAVVATTSTHVNIKPLIAVDQEGGVVSRVNFDNLDNISQKDIKTQDEAFTVANNRGKELKQFGINVNFSPILEIPRIEDSYISKRAFMPDTEGCSCSRPSDEEQIIELGRAMISGYEQSGIIPVAKHFPGGLARTKLDPHKTLPALDIDKVYLDDDLEPYKKLILEDKIKSLMITHLLYSRIDKDNLSSMSPVLLDQILRGELGYKGVIITDDLAMKAVTSKMSIDKAAISAFKAGADMVLVSDINSLDQSYQALFKLLEANEVKMERVDQSLKRILKL